MTQPRSSPPFDVVRAFTRVAMAVVGLAGLIAGVAWLYDGGTERWPAYLGFGALALLPSALLLVGWRRMHRAAGRRATTAARQMDRTTAHNGWRIEASLVGAVLLIAALGALVGGGIWGFAAAQRLGWDDVRASFAGSEARDANCDSGGCTVHLRLTRANGATVYVDAPGRLWPSDDELRNTDVTVYLDPADPMAASADSPTELALGAVLILAIGVTLGGAAWTVLSDAGTGPEPPPRHTMRV